MRWTRRLRQVGAAAVAGGLALALPAAAGDRVVTLVSGAPAGSTSLHEPLAVSISDSGGTVVFSTRERLVPADTDESVDVYMRRDGALALASHGEVGGNGGRDAGSPTASQDGTTAYFTTDEQLTFDDDDSGAGAIDVYAYRDGVTRLLARHDARVGASTAAVTLHPRLPQPSGSRVIVHTAARLVPEDTDGDRLDLYEDTGGIPRLLTPGTVNDVEPFDATRDLTGVLFGTADDLVPATDDDSSQEDTYLTIGGDYTHMSRGPTAASGGFRNYADLTAADASRTVLVTQERLDAADDDGALDVYLSPRTGPVTWISKGPSTAVDANVYGASEDLSVIAFTTPERILPADRDAAIDVYVWRNGALEVASTGTAGGNAEISVPQQPGGRAGKVSSDGRGVIFNTSERLVSEDTDDQVDLYEHIDGATRLVSVGEVGDEGGTFAATGTYRDGVRRIYFRSSTAHVRADVDRLEDLYVREDGVTALATPSREAYEASSVAISRDGVRGFFMTRERLTADDADEARDLYEARLVIPPPPAPTVEADTAPPRLGLSLSRRTFRRANRRAVVSARRRTPVGTTITLDLSEPALVNLRFARREPGRISRGRCRAPSRRLRRARRCTRELTVSSGLSLQRPAGRTIVRFYGRLDRGRLRPGAHALYARAYDAAGNRGDLMRLEFRVARR